MAYVDGTLLVAGLSNEEFSSTLRRIPFPFTGEVTATSLEIFHVSHGKWETAAPIRTFVPYEGGASILASYTCTPVVHFPLADLQPGAKAMGRTVAELGAVNQPLDMVSFTQDGEEHLLVANSRPRADEDRLPRHRRPGAADRAPASRSGVPRETKDLQGISRLANLNGSHVLALQARRRGRPAICAPEDRLAVALERHCGVARLAEVSWSRCGGDDCIRRGWPGDAGPQCGQRCRVVPDRTRRGR